MWIIIITLLSFLIQYEMGSDYLHPSKVSCLPLVLSFFFVQSQPSKKLYRDEETLVKRFTLY